MKLKTLKAEVKEILEKYPPARDSNAKLYGVYLGRHGISTISIANFYDNFNKYNVSDFESVTRMRRKLVEENPNLGPSKEVKEKRYEKEVDFYDFIKGRD